MKKVLVIAVLTLTFALSSCSKSKEDQCAKAIDHTFSLMMNDPQMKKMPKEMLDKMKKGMEAKKKEGVKECIEKFDQGEVDCVMSAKTMQDLGKCDKKK